MATARASDSCLMLDYLRVINFRIIIIIIIFFIPSVSMIPRDFGKKLSEIQNVGVTITPGSPRG